MQIPDSHFNLMINYALIFVICFGRWAISNVRYIIYWEKRMMFSLTSTVIFRSPEISVSDWIRLEKLILNSFSLNQLDESNRKLIANDSNSGNIWCSTLLAKEAIRLCHRRARARTVTSSNRIESFSLQLLCFFVWVCNCKVSIAFFYSSRVYDSWEFVMWTQNGRFIWI